ncbi:MAG: hypothetical protein ACK41T_10935 [Pseudobdellovibrio sp.]
MLCLSVRAWSAEKSAATAPVGTPIPTTSTNIKANSWNELKISQGVNIRTLLGDRFCSLKKDTRVKPLAISKDRELIEVLVNVKDCPKNSTGFVDMHYLLPADRKPGANYDEALVDIEGLSLRASPRMTSDAYLCSLPKSTELMLYDEFVKNDITTMRKVGLKDPVEGCPSEGWVSTSYLKPDVDFSGLKVKDRPANKPKINSESGNVKDCKDCSVEAVGGSKNVDNLKAVVGSLDTTATASAAVDIEEEARIKNPFIEAVKKLELSGKCDKSIPYPCSRGLISMPVIGKNAGFCGSNRYNPDSLNDLTVDTYAAPHTACAMVAMVQEWKKTHCPNNDDGCRFSWGDISHRTKPRWDGHNSHTDGECIDIRPMRKGSFSNLGLTWKQSQYDQDTTKKFIEFAKGLGATEIYFNDPKVINDSSLGVKHIGGHDNHVHLCFRKNDKVKKTCNELKVDKNICPELQ